MKRLGLALKPIHRDEVHLLSTCCSRVHVILSLSLFLFDSISPTGLSFPARARVSAQYCQVSCSPLSSVGVVSPIHSWGLHREIFNMLSRSASI